MKTKVKLSGFILILLLVTIFRIMVCVAEGEETQIMALDETALLNSFLFYPDEKYLSDCFKYRWDDSDINSVKIVFGPVIHKERLYYSVGKIAYGSPSEDYTGLYTNVYNDVIYNDGTYEILFDNDTCVYEYDYSRANNTRLSLGIPSSIIRSAIADGNMINGEIIPWELEKGGEMPSLDEICFTLSLVVDGYAADVYSFIRY